jgi:RNA polymerase sigma-70 factor, ECF subfamily
LQKTGDILVISDEDLMIATSQGDIHAFEEIMRRYQAMVWRTACRFSGDAEEARDITQSVFLKLFESAPGYRRTASLKTYLFRIAHNACIDHCRKKRPLLMGDIPDILDEAPLQSDKLLTIERDKTVRTAIQSLPPKQRFAILLRYDDELSIREIAEIMRTSEKAAERLLAHARETLCSTLRINLENDRGIL